MATYVVSDLHGQFHLFAKLLKEINFNENDFMYILGDAIDRGPDGILLLQAIKDAPNMDLLIGNHEFLMLQSVSVDGSADLTGADATLWTLYNGGEITYEHYEDLLLEERKDLLEWLNTRKLTTVVTVNDKKYCLTHSFFNEEGIDMELKDIDKEVAWECVWCSPFRQDLYKSIDSYNIPDTTFIIGHVPVQRVVDGFHAYKEENVILIDGGCAMAANPKYDKDTYGIICLCLDDMKENVIYMSEVE